MAPRDDHVFREHRPDARLAARVAAVWTRGVPRQPEPAAHRRVLPDGCADVILAFAPVGVDEGGPLALADAWVVGTMTTAHVVPPGARAAYVGVRFRAGHAGGALGTSAHALTDARLGLDALWPDAGALLRTVERVDDLATARERLIAALAPRLAAADAPPPAVREAVRRLEASGGRLRVEALGDALGVTRQHLARLFARHVGLSPKAFARVARLRALQASLHASGAVGANGARRVAWSALAQAHGFADQAHLVDEVRALTGLTPTAWLRERRAAAVPFRQDAGPTGD